jgi:glycosyltransferase involved in cell wall biosynthesis
MGACARLSSRVPARIVSCGHATARTHTALGYAADKIVVIPNAVDTLKFQPDAAARAAVRAELGLATEAFVVGVGARFDPQKDHETMLAAWGQLHARGATQAHLLLFGKDMVRENATLAGWIARHSASQVHLLGPRSNVARLFAACDASCLSSAYGEGLPNIVAEAMACALPCAVTEVGDSAWVVGDTGFVSPPRDVSRLADGLWRLATMTPEALADLGGRARRRVEVHFDLEAVAAQYYALYDEVSVQHWRGGP